ncbi:MAG: hypothetical protein ABI811_20230 [Acidobacteriota bacterium]
MNTRVYLVVGLCAVLALGGCKRRPSASDAPKEEPVELLSVLQADDPKAAVQFAHGFYGLEGNNWRWTAAKFGVVLAPPAGGADRGARLELKFTIPAVIFDRLGPATLSVTVNGVALSPETYSKSGEYSYVRDVNGDVFAGGPVTIEFQCDKALPPENGDNRELSLIVTSIGLAAK